MNNKNIIKMSSWLLGLFVILLALGVWANERLGSGKITAYTLFPLLGLGAFSLMWTHYVVGSIRRLLNLGAEINKAYLHFTSVIVLALIFLHPGILILQLSKDGFGLPPNSYLKAYPEPYMKGAIMLGTIGFIIFLLFEFKNNFQHKRWWRYVEYAQVFAMFLIFYHGLTLGRELSSGWYRGVWYFYGISLVAAVIYNYWYDRNVNKGGEKDAAK